MADSPSGQRGKGGGARKYGQNKRQPAKMRYRHKAAKKAKLLRKLEREPNYKATGYELRPGYGLVEV